MHSFLASTYFDT